LISIGRTAEEERLLGDLDQGFAPFQKSLNKAKYDLRKKYRYKPLSLAERLGVMLPVKPEMVMKKLGLLPKRHRVSKGIRNLVWDICTLNIKRAAVRAPRGGGKSMACSFVEFFLNAIRNFEALDIETPIATTKGWKRMGDLKVGDYVFDENGQPTEVTKIFKVAYDRPCYELVFSDGSTIVADAGHKWVTWDLSARRCYDKQVKGRGNRFETPMDWSTWQSQASHYGEVPGAKVRTTLEIKKTLKSGNGWNHWIPNGKPFETSHDPSLPIDPWVLGYLLGDGDTWGGGRVSTHPDDKQWVMQQFELAGYVCKGESYDDRHFGVVNPRGGHSLRQFWKKLGLREGKFIPEQYFYASIEQRLELVRGMMDSDGSVHKHGHYLFTNTNRDLIDGFAELITGLGMIARIHKQADRSHLGWKTCWNVMVHSQVPLARMPRKVAKHKWGRRAMGRFIVDVREVPSRPVRCIQVDSTSNLFRAGFNTVNTHNCLNMGGSEQQAFAVYRYLQRFIKSHPFWRDWYPTIQLQNTESKVGAWIKVLTASQKSIRSPHAGGIRPDLESGLSQEQIQQMDAGELEEYLDTHDIPTRDVGGILVFDEEAEAEREIVMGVLPTVNTARPSVILRLSTFHRTDGTYGELIDHVDEMGYQEYSWDIFDVAEKCEYKCSECPGGPDFSQDIFHITVDETTGKEEVVMKHPAYCAKQRVDGTWEGKAHYSSGWVPMEEIFQAWRESNHDCDYFEVEFMGWKPSQAGKVFKDRKRLEESWVPTQYIPGHPCTITIDWGLKGECAVEVWQEQPAGVKALLECEVFTQTRDTYIYEVVKGFGRKYNTRDVRGDSSHPYCVASDEAVLIRYSDKTKMFTLQKVYDKWFEGSLVPKEDLEIWDGEQWTPLLFMQSREVDETVKVRTTNPGAEVFTSTDHPFFREDGGLIRADELRPGDFAPAPVWPTLSGNLKVSDSMGWLMGMFIAEGWYSRYYDTRGIYWRQNDTSRIERELKNLRLNYRKWGDKIWCSSLHDRFLSSGIQPYSHFKCLPRKFFELDLESQCKIFSGMMDGDGCVRKGHGADFYDYATVSRFLAQQVQTWLQSIGINAHFRQESVKNYQGIYRVYFRLDEETSKLFKLSDKITFSGWTRQRKKRETKTKIHRIDRYTGDIVYDLTTASGKFMASGVVVHNCNRNLMVDPRYRMNVVEVNFQTQKEGAAGAWNSYIEREMCKMDPKFKQFRDRAKNWSRGRDGKIKKGDDHECDAGLCFFSKFAEGEYMHAKGVIRPRTFQTAPQVRKNRLGDRKGRLSGIGRLHR